MIDDLLDGEYVAAGCNGYDVCAWRETNPALVRSLSTTVLGHQWEKIGSQNNSLPLDTSKEFC